ncbi:MAG: hypothetical protein ABIH11_04700 [Candidatus Altiarchaeota archaeon]
MKVLNKAFVLLVLALLSTRALAANGVTAKAVEVDGSIAVAEPVLYGNNVKVSIRPSQQKVREGDTIVYYITIEDMHPRPTCRDTPDTEVVRNCMIDLKPVRYGISVSGLPFGLEHTTSIELKPGEVEEFKLVVDTSMRAEVIKAYSNSEEGEAEVSSIGLVNRPYHFTVSAYGEDGSRGYDKAILNVYDTGSNKAEVYVNPSYQNVVHGGTAVYYVKLKDNHPVYKCAALADGGASSKCLQKPVEYSVGVSGLPFGLEYPDSVSVYPGSTAEFKIVVDTDEYEDKQVMGAESTASTDIAVARMPPAREYRFEVYVKAEDGTMGSGKATLNVGWIVPPIPPGEEVIIKLDKGWNLASLPGDIRYRIMAVDSKMEYAVEEVDTMHSGKYFFIYLKDEKRFVSFTDARRILGSDGFRKYLMQNSFWVYTPVEDSLRFRVAEYTTYAGLPIEEGWNFVPVTDDMDGKSLEEVSLDCDFDRAYAWRSSRQSWERMSGYYEFGKSDVFHGFVVKAREDCTLGKVGETIPTPPTLPGD